MTRVGVVRVMRGISQARMAELTGMSRSSWVRFERGERRVSLEVWINTAFALGCYFEDLVGRKRLRTWVDVRAHPMAPDVADELWSDLGQCPYDEILERLDEFERGQSH